MARVIVAKDERLGRRVAIKRLHADSPGDAAERFEREAQLGASLNHPNLVSIYDVTAHGEAVLIVMEYVEGETLRAAIARGALEPGRVAQIVSEVAAALDHAHADGIVHRDVKPANILLREDGVTKLADLGIATAAESTRITRSGVVLGTAAYMAPEQLGGQPAGPPADVYALAAVAFEALCGCRAREGATPMQIAHRVVNEPPPDLRDAWEDAPDAAAEVLAQAMAVRPEERPSSAGELAERLGRALAPPAAPDPVEDETERTLPMEAAAVAVPPPRPRTPPRHPAAAPPRSRPPPPPPAPARPGPAPASSRGGSRSWLPVALAAALLLAAVGAAAFVLLGGGGEDEQRAGGGDATQTSPRPSGGSGEGSGEAPSDQGGASPTPAPAEQGTGSEGDTGSQPQSPNGEDSAGSSDPKTLNEQGYALMEQGRYDEAIPMLEQAVAAYPEGSSELTYAYALYNLGRSLRLAGRPDEAIPILERRLQIPNQTATVRRELEAAERAAG